MSEQKHNDSRKQPSPPPQQQAENVKKYKTSSQPAITSGFASQIKHVDAADLEKESTIKKKDQQTLDQLAAKLLPPRHILDSAVAIRRKCKLTQIILPEPGEDRAVRARELQACLQVVHNCLVASGILPVNTPDPSDRAVVARVFDALPAAPQVFSVAYILHALLVSPDLCRYFIDTFGVDARRLDEFANTLQSPVTAHQAWYISGRIRTTHFFVTYAVQQWLEFGPPTRRKE